MTVSDCAVCASLSTRTPLWEDELWHVSHDDEPAGVAGWMMLMAKRHVGGPAHFDEREARSFGLVLRHLELTLERVTGALRIYTAALGEAVPHFHCHMVPRYAAGEGQAEVKGWSLFDQQRKGRAGEIVVPSSEVQRISTAYRSALIESPPRY
jgi:diadenosine tetraphosphate (Ap4A) HIT family hydrolase